MRRPLLSPRRGLSPPSSKSSPTLGAAVSTAQIIEEIWQNKDRAYNVRRLVKRLQRVAKSMSGEAYEAFAAFIPDGDVGDWASQLPALLRTAFGSTMQTLRDPAFQDLLENYPRGRRSFVVA